MRGVRISYLVEHPEYTAQLGQWLFEQWDSILGEKTLEAQIRKTECAHESRSIAYCMGCACSWTTSRNCGPSRARSRRARRPDSLARRSICGLAVSAPRYRCSSCCVTVEDAARAREIQTLCRHTRQAGVVLTQLDSTCPLCLARAAR